MFRGLRRVGRTTALLLPLGLAACQMLIKSPEDAAVVSGPVCLKDPSLEAVARDIDHIEKHVDYWGSITTKHPDVWGAARMTKYQQEVEKIFALESNEPNAAQNIDKKVTVFQGARARTDQAFLAQAVAINAALTGRQAALLPPDPITVVTGTRTLTGNVTAERTNTGSAKSSATSSSDSPKVKTTNERENTTDGTIKKTASDDVKQVFDTKAPPTITTPTDAKIPADFETFTNSAVNVNRNPATIASLPGFGADGGLQLEPTIILDEKKRFLDHLNQIRRVNEGDDTADSPGYALYLVRVPVSVLPGKRTDTGHGAEIMMTIKPIIGDDLLPATFRNLVINDMVDQFSELLVTLLNVGDRSKLLMLLPGREAKADEKQLIEKRVQEATKRVRPRYTSPRPSRNAEYAFPMNHLYELFGETYVRALVTAAVARYQSELEQNKVIHLHEVRSAVREQIVAGYRFLTTGNPHAWSLCTQDLARAVRDLNGNVGGAPSVLHTYHDQYDKLLGREHFAEKKIESDRLVIKALGWAVLLESALLNELLVRDIKETMTHKGCACTADGWQDYFSPNPSPTARQAFNEYVTCRWPLYTFAVDPVTEQQNVQDTLSQRREMQLALSLAFSSGAISARSFTRYARRLEADYQAIDLNRTAVGFSHGDSTFGWRFYPRFQTPEIPGNLTVLTRDLIGGRAFTKRQEIHDRRLEPGQRECVALVIMPSFVPFAEINVSSSWFNLNDPKCKSHSTKETVKLSQRLQAIETVNPKDGHCYLNGEFARMQAKARMLAARLPLQDMKFPVPYENTLGGFEFFNSGITDLAPQLRGWYGAAGYDGNPLELFLMGENFSVANTRVIAGGKEITPKLLSRQVLSITLPAGAAVSEDKVGLYSENGKFIDIRLATPYGVAGPLRFPVLGKAEVAPAPVELVRPTLSPPADKQVVVLERDTDLILTGTDFTADTRVFAGGKACSVEVLSKTVVRVTVPKGVSTVNGAGNLVELKAATAGGASNAIYVPILKLVVMLPPAKPPVSFDNSTLTIAFRYKNLGIVAVDEPNRRPQVLTAVISDPAMQLDGKVEVEFKSALGTFKLTNVTFNPVTRRLEDFSALLMQKVVEMCTAQFGPENVNPPSEIKLTATLKPKQGDPIVIENGLTIKWIRVNPAENK